MSHHFLNSSKAQSSVLAHLQPHSKLGPSVCRSWDIKCYTHLCIAWIFTWTTNWPMSASRFFADGQKYPGLKNVLDWTPITTVFLNGSSGSFPISVNINSILLIVQAISLRPSLTPIYLSCTLSSPSTNLDLQSVTGYWLPLSPLVTTTAVAS